MNIYEDEEVERDKSVAAFFKQNKPLVFMAVAFVIAYAFMNFVTKGLDEAVAEQKEAKAAKRHDANPWAKELKR